MIQLREEGGDLYLGDDLLFYRYPAGDYDTINAANPNSDHLRAALYDARECGELLDDCGAVMLPSGEIFRIDGSE